MLQIRLYNLSRLIYDYQRDVYESLDQNEIGPTLYAAPWFLTLFASQFPLGFVVRVLGRLVYPLILAIVVAISLHKLIQVFIPCNFVALSKSDHYCFLDLLFLDGMEAIYKV